MKRMKIICNSKKDSEQQVYLNLRKKVYVLVFFFFSNFCIGAKLRSSFSINLNSEYWCASLFFEKLETYAWYSPMPISTNADYLSLTYSLSFSSSKN
jgi:hypothetical protein